MTWHLYIMRRWVLWGLLVALIATLLGALVWLAWRYELSQVQDRLDRETIEAVSDIRSGLNRNTQSLQTLLVLDKTHDEWRNDATLFLKQHRELVRLELRKPDLKTKIFIESPYRLGIFNRYGRDSTVGETTSACNMARRLSSPAYANSNYISQTDGAGLEVMDFCMPIAAKGQLTGYLVATYSLLDILSEMVSPQYTKTQQISFIESDGTRLAMLGMQQTVRRTFVSQQLLDMPGHAMVVKLESWRATPDLFPNVLTVIVLFLALALITVLFLLARDMRRRQRAELSLADALAFRKAMEDSLVTGLRARDNQGRITYVNPAFCEMVGLPVEQLLGQAMPAPYWPPEMVAEYGQRQALRLAGDAPPREGVESVFMRQNGERFPVLIFEAPLLNTQGEQTGWMSAVLDISEQRRTEELNRASMERLQATARLATVGEMASMLSHELNQPLAAISSYATGSINMLENPLPDSQQLSHALSGAMHHIAQQAERAGQVIKSVHDFVRRRDQAREKVAPIQLIQNIMPLMSLQATKLGIKIQVVCSHQLPHVICDRTMVEQVLLNLARNGMQAMHLDGQLKFKDRVLTIKVQQPKGGAQRLWLNFEVIDCGPGISQEVEQNLFTPFFTTKAEGMGLGLSLCRTVIEQHGGAMAHQPHQPRGTVFRFTLPASVSIQD